VSLFNQLGEFELNQLIARRLTTPGPAPSPTVEPAIFPSLVLESDRPEWGYISGERLCGVGGAVTAVAAQYSSIAIINPVGSRTIAVVEASQVSVPSGGIRYQITQAGMALTVATPGVRDSRWNTDGLIGSGRGVLTAGIGATLVQPPDPVLQLVTTGTYLNEHPFVIHPGWTLVLQQTVANVAINSAFILWRERTAQPGEL